MPLALESALQLYVPERSWYRIAAPVKFNSMSRRAPVLPCEGATKARFLLVVMGLVCGITHIYLRSSKGAFIFCECQRRDTLQQTPSHACDCSAKSNLVEECTEGLKHDSTAGPETIGSLSSVAYRRLSTLQHILEEAIGRDNIIGNIAMYPEQVNYYLRKASNPSVRTICEVGFGVGHSTIVYLTANPSATLYTFDWFVYMSAAPDDPRYTAHRTAVPLLQNMFGSRWIQVPGDSASSLKMFRQRHSNVKCDLVSIDGGHFYDVVRNDTVNILPLTRENAELIYDDLQDPALTAAVNDEVTAGNIAIKECVRASSETDVLFSATRTAKKIFCTFEPANGVKGEPNAVDLALLDRQ